MLPVEALRSRGETRTAGGGQGGQGGQRGGQESNEEARR